MDEHQETIDRLHAVGAAPVDARLTRTTLDSMTAGSVAARRRRTRVAIASAAVVGFFAGSFGLASAGALPPGLQDTAQSVLERVGVDVPPGHERYNDPTVCPGGPYRNHGEYVRTHKDDPNAGASPCGKPLQSVNGTGDKSDATESKAPDDSASDASDVEGPGNGKGKSKHSDQGETDSSESSESASDVPESDAPESSTSEPASETPPVETDGSTASSS